MSKTRPFIPPPVLTPPALGYPACATCSARAGIQRCPHPPAIEGAPPALAIVAPPGPVSGVKVLPDRIEYTHPTITLREHVILNRRPGEGVVQTNTLNPSRAFAAHGMLIVEELGMSIPLDAIITVRTPKEAS